MRNFRIGLIGLALTAALPLHVAAQQPTNSSLTQIVDKIVAQEQAEVQLLSPVLAISRDVHPESSPR